MLLAESALYYYRARTYDPKVGRFLQGDPLPPRPEEMNAYAYVGSNPVNATDPTGLWIAECYRPLGSGGWPLLYHKYVVVSGQRYGFFPDSVHVDDPHDAYPPNPLFGEHCKMVCNDSSNDPCVIRAIMKWRDDKVEYNKWKSNCYDFVQDAKDQCGL